MDKDYRRHRRVQKQLSKEAMGGCMGKIIALVTLILILRYTGEWIFHFVVNFWKSVLGL